MVEALRRARFYKFYQWSCFPDIMIQYLDIFPEFVTFHAIRKPDSVLGMVIIGKISVTLGLGILGTHVTVSEKVGEIMEFTRMIIKNRTLRALSRSLPTAAVLACATALPKSADAASFDIFLIAEHSAPVVTGTSLSVTTQTVYQLRNLNTNFLAGSISQVNNFSFGSDTPLTLAALNDPSGGPSSGAPNEPWLTDQGENGAGPTESGATPAYVNAEISGWENSGIPGTTVDPDEQIDFGRNSSATFNAVSGGFTDLILADLGGLNPFNLSLCGDASCSLVNQIFGGFTRGVRNFLTGTGLFALNDDGAAGTQDQTWLFRFSDPVTNGIQITEDDNRSVFTGVRLQGDYIGVQSAQSPAPSPVPGPAGLPLLASGMVLLGWHLRRRKR